MKIWLDDIRPAPDNTWTVARTPDDFRLLLCFPGRIEAVSFDHDLGSFVDGEETTGSHCATWLTEQCVSDGYVPVWTVHSANPAGAENIAAKMRSAERAVYGKD